MYFSHLFLGTPAPPSRMTYTPIKHDAVKLEWEAPTDDGGSKVTGYLIEKRDARKNRWSYVHKVEHQTLEYEVPGLITGREYTFRVRPMNKIGLGDAYEAPEPIVVQSPFSEYNSIHLRLKTIFFQN